MSLVRAVRLRVPAGSAKPGPALGQALGPLGINMVDFCKKFNEQSLSVDPKKQKQGGYIKDTPLNVILFANSDRSYTFTIRSPSTSYLIKQAVQMKLGPGSPSSDPQKAAAFIRPEAIFEIAKIKQKDDHMWHIPIESIAKSIVGTCKTMGVVVREG
jgi:large subunit ribosomal protein L11